MELESIDRVYVSGALVLLGAVFCVANIWRSVTLKKGYSETTIKMQVAFIVFIVLGVVAVSDVIQGEAIAALLGGAVGYALGNKPWQDAKDE